MEVKGKITGSKALIILLASAACILLGALVIKSPTVGKPHCGGTGCIVPRNGVGYKVGRNTG